MLSIYDVVAIAQDLKSLIGRGAKRQFVLMRHMLRDLVILRYPHLTPGDYRLKRQIVIEIRETIEENFQEPERSCYLQLLAFDPYTGDADSRREEVIYRLGKRCSAQMWRRYGEELEFLMPLAEAFVQRLSVEAVA